MKRRKEVARSNRCIIPFLNPNGHAINQLKEGLTEMDANRALKCRASIQWSVAACERKQSQKKRLRTCHGRAANGMQPFICLLNSSIQWIATVSGDEWANENRIIHSLARSGVGWLLLLLLHRRRWQASGGRGRRIESAKKATANRPSNCFIFIHSFHCHIIPTFIPFTHSSFHSY